MNEQIREILSQCQLESIDGPEYPRWTDLEKFAELIVKRCTSVLDEDSYLFPELGGYAHDIRKLFGVKDI